MPIEQVAPKDLDAAIIASIPKYPNDVPTSMLVHDFRLNTQARVLEAFRNLKLKHMGSNRPGIGRVVSVSEESWPEAQRIGEEYMERIGL